MRTPRAASPDSPPRQPGLHRKAMLGAFLALVLALVLALSGCTDDSGSRTSPPRETPSVTPSGPAGEWSHPGLVDASGQPVEPFEPAPSGGHRVDVTDLGADPAPGTGDDGPAIRTALDDADAGDEVHLPAGVYDLVSPADEDATANIELRRGVALTGAGRGRTVLVSHFDGDDDSAVLRGQGIEDVTVSGLTITSRYDGPLGTDTDDDTAGGGPMFGIQIGESDGHGSARVLISGVRVERFQRHGISIKASREVTVRGNEVADATSVGPGGAGYGIAVEGRADQRDPEAANDSRHNAVVDNVLDGRHLRHAILLQFPTHNNLVSGNVVQGSLLDAIDLHGEGEYLNEISGNLVTGCRRAAVALGNSGGSTHAHAASGAGNWVHDNLLVGNQVGVLVILGTPETVIEANRIVAEEGSESGIELDDAPGTVLRDNAVEPRGVDDFVSVDDAER